MRTRRIFILMCLFLFIFTALLAKISYYQIFKGYSIARKAAAMRSKQIELKEYSRGEILDRNLLPLTSTSTSTAVYCLPQEIIKNYPKAVTSAEAIDNVCEFLSNALENKTCQEIKDDLTLAVQRGVPFVRIASDLSEKEIRTINSSNLSGIVIAPIVKRYRDDGFCVHLLGYMSGGEEKKGLAGIEYLYNDILEQNPASQELISVLDARGCSIQGLMFKVRQEHEKSRGTVVLTIDKRVQEIAEAVAEKKIAKGAIVVMDIENKEVLAMVSRPGFNPYNIAQVLKADTQSSLTNRALTRYHPGSMFKILVAAAALEENLVTVNDEFYCSGEYVFNKDVSINCWKEGGHGRVNFAEAFAYSCNPSFISVVLDLGRSHLLSYAEKLHVSDESIIGYKNNSGSYIKINRGDAALGNACLGQQGIMLSPLQIASLIATIADDGCYAPPVIVRYSVNKRGDKYFPPKINKERVISIPTARTVQSMMGMVVGKGTGKTASLNEVKVAGKTASSQTGRYKDNGEEVLNTWFGGFFPASNPHWAVVVLVEEGESGAANAAPVFKEIAQEMLKIFSTTGEAVGGESP